MRLTGVNNVHSTHGTTSVVEYPLLLKVQVLSLKLLIQLVDDVLDNGARVVSMRRDGALRNIVQMGRVKDVERLEMLIEVVEERGESGKEYSEDCEG